MTLCIRHCVECPKCRIRYLIASSPYANGSYILRAGHNISEEFTLYCSCGTPPAISRWTWQDLGRYSVSRAAHDRGYGASQEIVSTDMIAGAKNSR